MQRWPLAWPRGRSIPARSTRGPRAGSRLPSDLRWLRYGRCAALPACLPALEARHGAAPGVPLGLPSSVPLPLLQLDWCAPYAGVVRSALHALKYAGERPLAAPLGSAIAERWAEAGAGGDLLVPVPIHVDRLRRRGYDQAVLLAEAAAAGLRLPIMVALERVRATRPQFELGRERRAENVTDAFRVRRASCRVIAER